MVKVSHEVMAVDPVARYDGFGLVCGRCLSAVKEVRVAVVVSFLFSAVPERLRMRRTPATTFVVRRTFSSHRVLLDLMAVPLGFTEFYRTLSDS